MDLLSLVVAQVDGRECMLMHPRALAAFVSYAWRPDVRMWPMGVATVHLPDRPSFVVELAPFLKPFRAKLGQAQADVEQLPRLSAAESWASRVYVGYGPRVRDFPTIVQPLGPKMINAVRLARKRAELAA